MTEQTATTHAATAKIVIGPPPGGENADAGAEQRRPASGHVLDRPTWEALHGRHGRFARRHGMAVRYQADVAPFIAVEDESDPNAWADAAELLGPTGGMALHGVAAWPDGWRPAVSIEGVQIIGTRVDPRPEPEAVVLGPDDVPEMLDLVARTKPGPFLPRTVELGTYLGIRRNGALVAMAGERLRPPGWTEISAVCTDPEQRGQGLAGRLMRALAVGIAERGETPFLHAAASNTYAVRLYASLGFETRRTVTFTVLERA